EDGIRDRNVTGVQTCALPILELSLLLISLFKLFAYGAVLLVTGTAVTYLCSRVNFIMMIVYKLKETYFQVAQLFIDFEEVEIHRSEERRVGKEGEKNWDVDTE